MVATGDSGTQGLGTAKRLRTAKRTSSQGFRTAKRTSSQGLRTAKRTSSQGLRTAKRTSSQGLRTAKRTSSQGLRTAKRTSSLLLQPVNKYSNSVFILLIGYCYAKSHSQQTNEISLFFYSYCSLKIFIPLIYHYTISFSAFYYSLDVFSLFHRLF